MTNHLLSLTQSATSNLSGNLYGSLAAIDSETVNPASLTSPGSLGATTAELTLRMGLALTVVLLLLFGITTVVRRRGGSPQDGPRIKIQHQQQLSKHTTLTLLSAGAENLLIASNSNETTLLASGRRLTANPNSLPDDDGANPRIGSGAEPTNRRDAGNGQRSGQQRSRSGQPGGAGQGSGDRRSQIDIRSRSGPLKQLQDKTVRRG